MHYSPEGLRDLELGRQEVSEELRAMISDLMSNLIPLLTKERAREYIGHGVCRRLMILQQCISNVFTLFPPAKREVLNDLDRVNVEISLHALIINVHGVPDNLAWAYVHERGFPINERGFPVISEKVGLFRKDFRKEYLPAVVQAYLAGPVSTWYRDYGKNFRDALAHRIPPYIPPSVFTPGHQKEYEDLHAQEGQAIKANKLELALELNAAKHAIGISCPAFMHSFLDKDAAEPMLLHSQIITDTRTVMEIIHHVRPHLPLTAVP